jgi:hypothetical protein
MDKLSKRGQRARAQRARARRRKQRRDQALHALTTSALALPGLASQALAEEGLGITAEYNYARYSEDDLGSSKVAPGNETSRYEVDLHQFRFAMPVTERIDLDLEVAYETMTGASPWYIRPDATTGAPVQVMTGATIEDTRTDVLAKGTYAMDWGNLSGSGGVSIEKDYMAFNGGLGSERNFNEKNTTLGGGLGFSYDLIDPTQDGTSIRVEDEDKHSVTLFGSLSQVLGRSSAIQTTLTYQYAGGFLSDPYKLALVGGLTEADNRPDQRHQFSLLARYRKHFERVGGSFHFDYRFHADDWELNAHTFDVGWYQNLFDIVRLTPSIRYYSQSQAEFYAPFYLSAKSDGLYSSDYRLSPYGALSYRIKAETRFQTWNFDWSANVAWERYDSSSDLALLSVDVENPGLVSFNVWSVGLTGRF